MAENRMAYGKADVLITCCLAGLPIATFKQCSTVKGDIVGKRLHRSPGLDAKVHM